jgi:hypothetical protein
MPVGDAERTRFWEDVWLGEGAVKTKLPKYIQVCF